MRPTQIAVSVIRQRGSKLVELLLIVAIISLLSVMGYQHYFKLRRQAEQAACIKKVSQLGLAISNFVTQRDGFPVPPDEAYEDKNPEEPSDVKLDEWWFNTLKDYGISSPEEFVCPRDRDEWLRIQREDSIKFYSSYLFVEFSSPEEARWNGTPWVVDKASHDGKTPMYMPDGSVKMMLLPGFQESYGRGLRK